MIIFPYPVVWGAFEGIADWVDDWWNEDENETEAHVGVNQPNENTENQEKMQDAQVQAGTSVEQGVVNTQIQEPQHEQGQTEPQGTSDSMKKSNIATWLWIGGGVILLIVIIALVWYFVVKRK